ncbi:hypothetical protein BT63DRAFT_379891, partial [Microthyrium microscopicum]
MKALIASSKEAEFRVSEGVSLLSEDDQVLLRISKQCEELTSELLKSSTPSKSGLENNNATSPAEVEQFRQKIESIKEDLNQHLAPLQWSATTQTIRELAAKNGRLGAGREVAINALSSCLSNSFQRLKTGKVNYEQSLAIWNEIHAAMQLAEHYLKEQAVLTELQFWTMNRRQELISKEHENTFEWVLSLADRDESAQPASNFVQWLKSDEPVYWISGKPGSGKSTLMKFIADNSKTKDALKHWAANDRLIIASFYFWSSAKDPLQKSNTGLLRSILFQILRQCPELIEAAFSERWLESQTIGSLQEANTADLMGAYDRISGLLSSLKVKFCFFIDGLDEYEGDTADIIHLVELLSKTPNLKTCISSRQWAEFETKYGGNNPWKLYVHQLTKADMTNYVEDLLMKNDSIAKLRATDSKEEFGHLVARIVEAAEGVFLWVFLVVRALIEGLSENDRISDLKQRLGAIPSDLDHYFENMLLGIEARHQQQTAQLFLVTLQGVEKLPLICYWNLLNAEFLTLKGVNKGHLSKDLAAERLQEMATRLNTHCKGLLKAHNIEQNPFNHLKEHNWLFDFRVDFLHRTVADFLRTADMQHLLEKWSGPDFNADMEISKACLYDIKVT